MLCLIAVYSLALDIAEMRESYNDVLLCDQRFVIDILERTVDDLRYSRSCELILDLCHLIHDDLIEQSLVREYSVEIFDLFGECLDLCLELLSLETCETSESHVNDVLCLLVSKTESLAHADLGLCLGT